MKMRPAAEIIADFPDDAVEEDGEFVVFGGRGIAEALAEKFGGLGYVIEPVESEGMKGWFFVVAAEKKRIVFQVTDFGDGEYLLLSYSGGWPQNPDPQRARLLLQLNAELARDSRFREVRWVVRDDIHAGTPGHSSPVDEDDLAALMEKAGKPEKPSPSSTGRTADSDPPVGPVRRLLGIFKRR